MSIRKSVKVSSGYPHRIHKPKKNRKKREGARVYKAKKERLQNSEK